VIFAPSNLLPRNSYINASANNTFTWDVKGALQTYYQLKILNNNTSVTVYDSTQTLSSDHSAILPAFTLSNGTNYKYTVKVWGSDSTTATSTYQFISCASTPTATFTTPIFGSTPVELSSQDFTFVCNYSQAESISLKKYKFVLYDSTGTTIIEDSGWLYDFLLQYEFTGMVRGTTYKVECTVISQSDQEYTTDKKSIIIANYEIPDTVPDITAIADNSNGTITISWGDLKTVTPTVTGSSSYTTGKFGYGLQLNSSANIRYDESFTYGDYTFTYWIKFTYGQNGDFMQLGDYMFLGYENSTRRFYFRINSYYVYSDEFTLYTWEDVGSATWDYYSGKTFADLGFTSTDYIYNWIFIGLTSNKLVLKVRDEIRIDLDLL